MPEYEDLVRRALDARVEADSLQQQSRRIQGLAQMLREAAAGRLLLRRCAWCDRFELAGEWLQLEEIGAGQQRIAATLRARASHGICPRCYEQVEEAAAEARSVNGNDVDGRVARARLARERALQAHEHAVQLHLRAAELHDEAAAFQELHAGLELKLGHVEKAERMEALARGERERARLERERAERATI